MIFYMGDVYGWKHYTFPIWDLGILELAMGGRFLEQSLSTKGQANCLTDFLARRNFCLARLGWNQYSHYKVN